MKSKMLQNVFIFIAVAVIAAVAGGCSNTGDSLTDPNPDPVIDPVSDSIEKYNIERTLADGGQLNTIAFDGLAFLTNNLGAQSFLPPGKVADYCGFQYLRDNDPTEMGHNTDFVTIIAFNVMNILAQDQLDLMIEAAQEQIYLINEYAYKRFPLMLAFRRLLDNDLPNGRSELDRDKVIEFSAEIYRIDGEISYKRAELLGNIINSLTSEQQSAFTALKALNGVGNWNSSLGDPLAAMHLPKDVNVAVMTFASEMYSWYKGTIEADTYFCPERQGTYFGSFYLKDWPAMGNPNYTIDEQLTARAGEDFLNILTENQKQIVTRLVDTQRNDLHSIVECREQISTELRRSINQGVIDYASVLALSEHYGNLDGAIVYQYAVQFADLYEILSEAQRNELHSIAESIGYLHPDNAFLYSDPIAMPEIINTDFFFK